MNFMSCLVIKRNADYIFYNLKWPEGLVCPKCGSNHFYYIKGRDTYECADCGKQISLTAGTIMENSHLSYHTWLLAMYF